jgi:hypothetical protein
MPSRLQIHAFWLCDFWLCEMSLLLCPSGAMPRFGMAGTLEQARSGIEEERVDQRTIDDLEFSELGATPLMWMRDIQNEYSEMPHGPNGN